MISSRDFPTLMRIAKSQQVHKYHLDKHLGLQIHDLHIPEVDSATPILFNLAIPTRLGSSYTVPQNETAAEKQNVSRPRNQLCGNMSPRCCLSLPRRAAPVR